MIRDLEQTNLRYKAADSGSVHYQGIEWDAFVDFCKSTQMLERRCREVIPQAEVSRALIIARHARRILRSSPVHPSDTTTGLHGLDSIDYSRMSDDFADIIRQCSEKSQVLRQQENHPAWLFIEREVSRALTYSEASKYPEKNLFLVHDLAVTATQTLIEDKRWGGKAVSLTQARKSDLAYSGFIFGSPDLLTNWRLDPDQASQHVSWVFSSPISERTYVLCWPGGSTQRFSLDRYVVWGEEREKSASYTGPTQFNVNIDRLEELRSGPDTSAEKIRSLTDSSPDAVMATGFELINGQWIFYSNEFGPKPDLIEEDEFADVDAVKVRSAKSVNEIQIGTVLVVRAEDAARAFLEREAKIWCDKDHELGRFEKCLAVKTSYREGLRNLRINNGLLKLKQIGFSEDEARYRLNQIFDPNAIAPGDQTVFERICNVMEVAFEGNAWADVSLLRTAMRQAGHTARRKIADAIEKDQHWRALVNAPNIAEVQIEGAGSALLMPVLGVHPSISVNVSSLGELQ